jgi:hypothetical protein
MDFPHFQLQAGLAVTMFSPDVLPALYSQSDDPKQVTSRNSTPTVALRRRDVRESISDNGSEQRQPVRKTSMRTIGSFFRRKKRGDSSIHSSSQLATIWSLEQEEGDTNDTDEGQSQSDDGKLCDKVATGGNEDVAGNSNRQSE